MSDTPIYRALLDEYGGELPTVDTPDVPEFDLDSAPNKAA